MKIRHNAVLALTIFISLSSPLRSQELPSAEPLTTTTASHAEKRLRKAIIAGGHADTKIMAQIVRNAINAPDFGILRALDMTNVPFMWNDEVTKAKRVQFVLQPVLEKKIGGAASKNSIPATLLIKPPDVVADPSPSLSRNELIVANWRRHIYEQLSHESMATNSNEQWYSTQLNSVNLDTVITNTDAAVKRVGGLNWSTRDFLKQVEGMSNAAQIAAGSRLRLFLDPDILPDDYRLEYFKTHLQPILSGQQLNIAKTLGLPHQELAIAHLAATRCYNVNKGLQMTLVPCHVGDRIL